jgi:hypothetical protein
VLRITEDLEPVEILPHRNVAQGHRLPDEPAVLGVHRFQTVQKEIAQTTLK